MDGSKRTFFLVVSLCIFLAALGVSSARLVVRYRENLKRAQSVFQALKSEASTVLSNSGPYDSAWRTAAKSLYKSDASVLLVALHSPGEGILQMVPRTSPYVAGPVDARTVAPELLYPPQTVARLSAVFLSKSGVPVTLDVLYSLLRQSDVYEAARMGLLITAAWTALSLLASTILSLSKSSPRSYLATEPLSLPRNAASTPDVFDPEAGLSDEDFTLPEIPMEPFVGASLSPDSFESFGAAEPGSTPSPEGLYSPISGLGWEEYLAERLNSELSRASSFEQDLVLLKVSHPGIPRASEAFKKITQTLLEFFNFRDLAFEEGTSGFAVILPNINSEHALRMAEEFLKKLTSQLRQEGNSPDYLKVFIGLSSRSGRLVDADRLLMEANAALIKARDEGDTRIVAFKADPNKYRAFVASRE